MIQEIKMPAAGQTTNKAKIAGIHVKIGDTVKRGDILLDAETDKAVLPVESYAAGTVLAILVESGDDVTAGTVLMAIGQQGEVYAPASEAAQKPLPAAAAPRTAAKEEYRPIMKGQAPVEPKQPSAAVAYPAMPNAKLLARERGIDLRQIVPANGQFIKRQDVENYQPARQEALPYEVLPMTNVRAIIGRRMLESKQTIPAFQCTVSVNMENAMALRRHYLEKRDIKLSYNDILAKAVSAAAVRFPLVKARYEEAEIRIYHHTNIGLAVAQDGGLVVPVVRQVDSKGLAQIGAEYKALIAKARDNRLMPSDMGCGSITISNLGMYDVEQFTAIINPPESCILAVGSIQVEPVWDGEAFRPEHRMRITGSFDHRMIDGAYGAQFLQEVKLLMECPELMLC